MTRHPQHSSFKQRESRLRMKCPHCLAFAKARSSDTLTPTYREVRFECVNDACGHVWVAGLEALRTLCPSDMPNPDINLPFTAGAVVDESSSTAALAATAG